MKQITLKRILRKILNFRSYLLIYIELEADKTCFKGSDDYYKSYSVSEFDDANQIHKFYLSQNWGLLNIDLIMSWLKEGHRCFVLMNEQAQIIGVTWVETNLNSYKENGFFQLKKCNNVRLKANVGIISKIIIDRSHRGKQLSNYLIFKTVEILKAENINYFLAFVLSTNGSSLRSFIKEGANIIGIVKYTRIFNKVFNLVFNKADFWVQKSFDRAIEKETL